MKLSDVKHLIDESFKNIDTKQVIKDLEKEGYKFEPSGHKDTENKQHVEYSWDFLKLQMERLGVNKVANGGKYEEDNWKAPIDIKLLKKALFRHVLEVMEDNYNDEQEFGHIAAISVNAMFIYEQLKQEQ
jgi:hypothetical protein